MGKFIIAIKYVLSCHYSIMVNQLTGNLSCNYTMKIEGHGCLIQDCAWFIS